MRNFQLFADTYEGNSVGSIEDYTRAGHVILALKASEGTAHIDTWHAGRAREAHAWGLAVVHYHFARPDLGNDPHREAEFFVRVVKPTWRKGDYLWLDIERGVERRTGTEQAWCEAFCATVHSMFGATPIVYASESVLNEALRNMRVKGERYAPAKYGGSPSRLAGKKRKWSEQFTDGTLGHGPHSLPGTGKGDINILSLRVASAVRLRTGWRRWRALHPGRKH